MLLDTNVVLEYLIQREQYETVRVMFMRMERLATEMFISVGGFYTMLFLVDKFLRRERSLVGEKRIQTLRWMMEGILHVIHVAEHDKESLLRGITDTNYRDLEDSCQYQVAAKTGCNYIISFNVSDFPKVKDAQVQVLTPQQFLDLSANLL